VKPCAVLLASYNGVKFLSEQVRSIHCQSFPHIDLYVSDDGSTDGSIALLTEEQASWEKGKFFLIPGPLAGSAAENFRSLILLPYLEADFFAFSDQDDIWQPGKIEAAITRLKALPADVPAMHCCRTQLINEQGLEVGRSTYFPRPPHFRNALVQSLAGGNTMVINRAGFDLIRKTAARGEFAMHDWWAYLVISGAGGTIIYSETPDTLYRQHTGNVSGSNMGMLAQVVRLRMLLSGSFKAWNDKNISLLQACRDSLSPENLACLDAFCDARRGTLRNRLKALWRSGVFRQTARSQLMLYIACVLKRI